MMLALALSFARLGSVSVSAVFVAVFVIEPVVVTVAVRVNVALPALASAPMFHSPVALL